VNTRLLKADRAGIAAAAQTLLAGGLAAFPTETVYGLGADATNAKAVARLFDAKGRPRFNPLIAHFSRVSEVNRAGIMNEAALTLAKKFWPGPLTLVLLVTADCPVCDLARAGLSTVAVRVPEHRVANALLKAAGLPIVAPSANRSGHVSPTSAAHVMADLEGRIDIVLDGGATPLGLESTIVDCSTEQPRLLRPGAISRTRIEAALGMPVDNSGDAISEQPSAPGQLASHYAPQAAVRLDARSVEPGEWLLAFGPDLPAGADPARTLNLSRAGDLYEAAANLFAHLRTLDAKGAETIAVAPIAATGIGEAIRDRLVRAAAPR
jgi:L-threonylcarbamoyladenylate synthase